MAEATGLISFVLGGRLQGEGFAVVVTARLFWLYEAAWSGRGMGQFFGLTFEVLHELAPAHYSTSGIDIVNVPDHCLLWRMVLCTGGYFAAPPCFHSPDASNTISAITTKSISRLCQMSSPVENPCTIMSEVVLLSGLFPEAVTVPDTL